MDTKDAGRKGGLATKKKYGRQHFKDIRAKRKSKGRNKSK